MLGKANNNESEKSIISSDMKIKGKISADGELLLLGSVIGDIKCHSLSVENTGVLKGNIEADVVTVSGKCDGQVSADVVSIKSTGKISGEVYYENISIEEGAIVEAQIGKKKIK
jgi:cytoskeletal protein CcmA (bactofilin family)